MYIIYYIQYFYIWWIYDIYIYLILSYLILYYIILYYTILYNIIYNYMWYFQNFNFQTETLPQREPRNLAGGRCKTWEAREKGMVGSGGTLGEKDRGCLAPRISTVDPASPDFWRPASTHWMQIADTIYDTIYDTVYDTIYDTMSNVGEHWRCLAGLLDFGWFQCQTIQFFSIFGYFWGYPLVI